RPPLDTRGDLSLQLLPDLEDELRDRGVVELGLRRPQALGGDPRRVAGQRSEPALLRVRGDARQLQQLEGDARIEGGACDVDASAPGGFDPVLGKGLEEPVHAPAISDSLPPRLSFQLPAGARRRPAIRSEESMVRLFRSY